MKKEIPFYNISNEVSLNKIGQYVTTYNVWMPNMYAGLKRRTTLFNNFIFLFVAQVANR